MSRRNAKHFGGYGGTGLSAAADEATPHECGFASELE
jgi:hypothetical protein